ncbi:urea transporter [Polaribacter litorisediminis]|uniref:urea transporter n=1 Tax=Polaribacter litorisediminis TaxID=1908341 RepID=UPI001CC078A5|nr:urea transporter [Polaribacter litorisediminis]UAM98809.1 urea transporter [Polaribacter litorisediminis]
MIFIEKLKTNYWIQCILNSYSLVFFSVNNLFALCILVVTFFTPFVGISGFVAVVLINVIAHFIGFNKEDIKTGLFGFNALFVGMAMGYEFNFNFSFVILFISAIVVLLLITVSIKGFLTIYGLPFLILPFIITYWIVSLAAANFSNITLDESHIYVINESLLNEGSAFYQFTHSLDDLPLHTFVLTFFKTLAGTFFQNSVLSGMIIAFGLLQFSRIAFSLGLLGFACAYFYYYIFGADVSDLNNNLLGANFIFMGIAIGCFFLIPNLYSYLTVIILTPVVLLTSLALTKILLEFQIKPYSLSFSIITIIFLFALNQRLFTSYLYVVIHQYFSAEKTIYKYMNSLQRFKNEHLYKLALPFKGEWNVSQGYNGTITHLGYWSKALDFVIKDHLNNTYRLPLSAREGFGKDNFYCYNQEILAPYDGYVYDIINNVADNDIGDMDTENNWGNTIIINHLHGLFSQISHIKKDTFGVYIGQFVTKGTFLALCGNSGRSPEPHIHFQLQTTPVLGEVTYPYPIAYFMERKGDELALKISEVPNEDAFISNVNVNQLLVVAYSLMPGHKIILENEATLTSTEWEILTDAYNKTYIYCKNTKSYAYFVNDGVMFYFTDFEGDRSSLLFHFYLANYRQLLGYYEAITIEDKVPLIHFNGKLIQFFQDFLAPFYLFTKANYKSNFISSDNEYAPQNVIVHSEVQAKVMDYTFKKINFELEFKDHAIKRLTIHKKNKSASYSFTLK